MNCSDALAYIIEPTNTPDDIRCHIEECETCRAQRAESRRVASLVAGLPAMQRPDVAGMVMARIGYGNGRPTRDKILDQLKLIREELDATIEAVEDVELDVRPSTGEPTVSELLCHLPSAESAFATSASKSKNAQDATNAIAFANDAAHAVSTRDTGKVKATEELRRVRERTLRLVSEQDDALGYAEAELLRSVYRHEADHLEQIRDTLWRTRRRADLHERPV